MMQSVLAQTISNALNRDDALALLREIVGVESITGNEASVAKLLKGKIAERGFDAEEAEFLQGRPNVWGLRRGSGGGPHLLITGHTDTVRVDGWREKWAGTEREDPFGCSQAEGAVWGRGVTDLKGGIATSILALDLLDRAGVALAGDVSLAFVGDEESGEEGSGVSAGINHYTNLIAAGEAAKPDFAIYVEPTQLSVFAAQIGFFIADVTVAGTSAYFGKPELGVDALKAAHAILTKVWKHDTKLRAKPPHPLTGPSGILVTGIEAGGLIAVPGSCKFSIIGSLQPGESLNARTAELEEAIRATPVDEGITIDINYPAGRDQSHGGSPTEVDPTLEPIKQLQAAIKQFDPERGNIEGAPYWSEMPYLVERLGIPAVYCAAGDIACCHTTEEHLNIEEFLNAIRAFALFIANYCGVANRASL